MRITTLDFQCHAVTLEWFSIQLLVNSGIFKLSLNLSLGEKKDNWQAKHKARRGLGEKKKVGESVDFVLMPPIHDTRFWYHDLIGQITLC